MTKKVLVFMAIALTASLITTAIVEIRYATKYHSQVNVIKDRSKIGINPLPDALDFGDLPKGGGMTRFVTLSSKSGRDAYMFVYIRGAISPFVKLKKTWFVMKANKTKKLEFKLKIPASTKYKEYDGTIYIFRFPKFF